MAELCKTAVGAMFALLRKKQAGQATLADIRTLLQHKDYQFEFERYGERVTEQAFAEYFMNFEHLDTAEIQNEDLKNHHAYWLDLYRNLDWYEQKEQEYFREFDQDAVEEACRIAVNGFPKGVIVPEFRLVFTCGIGQSFGYPNGDGMHFDIMQLFREYGGTNFKYMIAHEIHHIIMDRNLKRIADTPEAFFIQCFSGEGLAVKFTGNAEGVLTRKIFPDLPSYLGLDEYSMRYLRDRFEQNFAAFVHTLKQIRCGEITTTQQVWQQIAEFWFNCYVEGQQKTERPKLKQSQIYSLGNELWGVIYDVYGMDELYELVNHPEGFLPKWNEAMRILEKAQYQILL